MYKILVVDDEQLIIDIIQKFLRIKGFEVVSALGGEKALEIIQSDVKIDLMILDLKMPGISGMDVLKKMDALNRRMPLIVLSGSPVLKDDTVNFLNKFNNGSGRPDVLLKPMDLYELLDKINGKLPQENL